MRRPSDSNPPLPHIPALDPVAFERSWQDAASLLAALNGAAVLRVHDIEAHMRMLEAYRGYEEATG